MNSLMRTRLERHLCGSGRGLSVGVGVNRRGRRLVLLRCGLEQPVQRALLRGQLAVSGLDLGLSGGRGAREQVRRLASGSVAAHGTFRQCTRAVFGAPPAAARPLLSCRRYQVRLRATTERPPRARQQRAPATDCDYVASRSWSARRLLHAARWKFHHTEGRSACHRKFGRRARTVASSCCVASACVVSVAGTVCSFPSATWVLLCAHSEGHGGASCDMWQRPGYVPANAVNRFPPSDSL